MIDDGEQIYISESEELLEDMETALLELEQSPNDADLINRIFRAVHTMKGSAGLFGFDQIIGFTHIVENVLDDVRNCLIPITDDLISLLMNCRDHIKSLIECLSSDAEADKEEEKNLIELLTAYKAGGGAPVLISPSTEDAYASIEKTTEKMSQNGTYHISQRLGEETFREGYDPATMFEELNRLGEIQNAQLVVESIPSLEDLDPEACYLGWEMGFTTQGDKRAIAEALEFMNGSNHQILPPESQIEVYAHLISQLPEDDKALGQILVSVGTVTEQELQHALFQQEENGGKTGDILVAQKSVQPQVIKEALGKQEKTRAVKKQETNFVRVDASKLDKMVNLVGELVIAGARVTLLSDAIGDEALIESLEEMTVALEEMRETALGLRMVPIGGTFNRFHRVVRDVSKTLKKNITLKIFGGDTELDKTVIDNIGDPLTHLIRNSIDHGVEAPEVRLAAGKDANGTITLSAFHETGTIVIEIKDDGKGLDPQQIFNKACERGLVSPEKKMSDDEIFRLIFEPGFSTAEAVSDISGRGVGMDVVRRNIESLRGTVEIKSDLGKGTRINIRLPLTLAIIDGFHVRVSNESFIIPLDMVVECVTLNETQLNDAQTHDYINLREEVLPLLRLKSFFDMGDNIKYGDVKLETDESSEKKRQNLVVVNFANKKAGLLVDALHGEVQAVIKPLGRVFHGLLGFAGFTILGSGQVALIIDVPGLIKNVSEIHDYQTMPVTMGRRTKDNSGDNVH